MPVIDACLTGVLAPFLHGAVGAGDEDERAVFRKKAVFDDAGDFVYPIFRFGRDYRRAAVGEWRPRAVEDLVAVVRDNRPVFSRAGA